jgi:hypothetical protein
MMGWMARLRQCSAPVALYCALLVVLTIGSQFLPEGVVRDTLKFEPKDSASEALKTLQELQVFVGALTGTLFAACGALSTKWKPASGQWASFDRLVFVLVLVCGAVSYYGLYLARVATLEMLSAHVLDPLSLRLQTGLALQYYGFLVGAVLLGLVFIRLLDMPSGELPVQH